MTEAALWDQVYRENLWNGVESRSGPGSGAVATAPLVPALLDLVARYRIGSVLDVACGDGYWMPELPGYVGIDRSAEAVRLHRERHPERHVYVGSVGELRGDMPAARYDLVIVRDVLQHLPLPEAVALVRDAQAAGTYLLASTYHGGENEGITPERILTGWAYDANLEAAPFGLPQALEYLPDGYSYSVRGRLRDTTKYLGLWRS